jgi:hypothetical protein
MAATGLDDNEADAAETGDDIGQARALDESEGQPADAVTPLRPFTRAERAAIAEEAERLTEFLT